MMSPPEHSITIPVPPAKFELEAKYFQPESDESPAVCIIVCHPHPTMGGDMDNNVVVAIFNEFVTRQWPVLRFNFRGVGRSGGTFDNGIGEIDDVKAAMQFFSEYVTAPQVFVVGYSFGAAMGGAAAAESPAALG